MDVDSNGSDTVSTATDEAVNVRATRNRGSRSRSRKQSPALQPTSTDSLTTVSSSSLASVPTASTSAAGSTTAALSPTSSSVPPAPSSITASISGLSSPASSSFSPATVTSSFLLSSLPSIPPPYFASADAIVDRLDFYILQLHLNQKTIAYLTSLPLTTVSQLIRRVYKPWPTHDQPLTAAASAGSAFIAVVALLWWLDGMLSSVVRSRVSNVHDTWNLAFLSSLTVSGLSRERLNVWLDGKTVNPLHDRQWIDEIAMKEFGVTQESVVREWEKVRGAALAAGATEAAGAVGGTAG